MSERGAIGCDRWLELGMVVVGRSIESVYEQRVCGHHGCSRSAGRAGGSFVWEKESTRRVFLL